MSWKIVKTADFLIWMYGCNARTRDQVEMRLSRITEFNHFGDYKLLDDHLLELRWRNGMRVYFSVLSVQEDKILLLLMGGNKNSQSKDIARARRNLREYHEEN